jgi:hypothetical protein
MANRFKKMTQPLLDESRREGYKAGHKQGMKDGFQKKTLAYENEIEYLKTLVQKLAERIPAVPGPEIADPNIMELCFRNGENHMRDKIKTSLLKLSADMPCVTISQVIKILEDLQ